MLLPPARRPLALLVLLGVCFLLLFLSFGLTSSPTTLTDALPPSWFDPAPPIVDDWSTTGRGRVTGAARVEKMEGLKGVDSGTRKRVERLVDVCEAEDAFEKEYGRTNLRLTRGYEGSHHRVREFVKKMLRGDKVTISAIGGSITAGHHVWDNEAWFWKLGEWMDGFFKVKSDSIIKVNGAAPAVGSDYFSFCFPLHIPTESDLVLVELGVNDAALPEHVENMENLLRGLLGLPHSPAVILVEAMAFSNGGMGGGGGRMHLPVAQYYDVPVINQRHPLANHFARFPELVRPYFAQDWWGNPDTRHVNSRGHRDLGNVVASFIKDSACLFVDEPGFGVDAAGGGRGGVGAVTEAREKEYGELVQEVAESDVDEYLENLERHWADQSRAWRRPLPRPEGEDGDTDSNAEPQMELMPGMWMSPPELGLLPRMRVLDGWNPDLSHRVPPFHPICHSTRAQEPAYNLTPIADGTEGWEYWVHPEHLDKPYLVATTPGAQVKFEIDTSAGVIKIYVLKSRTFGLGKTRCWIGEEEEKGVVVDGFWEDDANIGQFATVRDDLDPGRYKVTCRLLEETSDPGGGTEFRIISLMSL